MHDVLEKGQLDWSLRQANQAEIRSRYRRIRLGTTVLLASGAVVGAVVGLTVIPLGPAWAALGFIGSLLGASLISRVHARRLAAPLESSAIVGAWLAGKGLLDEEGRITERGKKLLLSERGLESQGVQSSVQELRAIRAFLDAGALYRSGREWLTAIHSVRSTLDTRDVERRLESEVGGARFPKGVWFVVAPLALIGGAILVLSLVSMALEFID